VPKTHGPPPPSESGRTTWFAWVSIALLLAGYGVVRMSASGGAGGDDDLALRLFAERVTVFVLSCFVGWQVVWNVTPALHTPLMSVTNAISGIIVLGGMLHTRTDAMGAAAWLGVGAVFLAMINVAGGFLVTRRMLEMFRK
jgi:NAD(P) transhydrogenase subunit alpha